MHLEMHKIYKLGGRNIHRSGSKLEGEALIEIGVEGNMEWGLLLELKVVGHFPLYLYWAYLKWAGSPDYSCKRIEWAKFAPLE